MAFHDDWLEWAAFDPWSLSMRLLLRKWDGKKYGNLFSEDKISVRGKRERRI